MHRRAMRNREINPALRIRDFYSFGLQVLNEINFARMHPDEFVQKLEELNSTISKGDNSLYIEGVPFLYTDLKSSLEEAISFLSKQKSLAGLIYNKTITQACDYLLDELIIHDGLEEENTKYNLENRLSKYGQPLGECYELIDYGMFDPEFIVINFILCDGDIQKYERNVIFNPKIKCLGIASSILPSDKICTVINFCEEFYDKFETIPLDVQMKYKKSVPTYTTKTIKSYSNQRETGVSNPKNEEKDYLENDFNDYDIKRKNSGKTFSMKRNQFIERRNSIKQKKEQEDKKRNNQQRGGTINIQPRGSRPKDNIPEQKKEEFDNDEDDDFRDDGMVLRRKRTIHQPKMMEVIEEENLENEDPFDREFKIESPKKKRQNFPTKEKFGKVNNFADNNKKTDTNSTVETKYVGNKKVTTTTTTKTETGGDGKKKVVTTTVTEEIGGGEPRIRNKVVKDIPFKSFGRRNFQNPKDEFNIEKEMKELEKNFDSEFGNFSFKSPIKPVFESTDDMFEKEDDIDMPEGAISVEVKQKTITDSKGKPVLIVHKTINYENGEKKTIIEKQNIVKK